MSHNARIAESGAILHLCVTHMGQDARSTIDHTNLSITEIWYGTIK